MAGRIPQAFIDEIVARSDIVEIIGARVPLKKAGREYKANCPFHSEKSPSFWVSPDKQFYHCFGCGAHGTVVGFLMQYEKLGFLDAVADLAQRAGLELPREAQTAQDPGSADLHEVMARAARFFEQNLPTMRALRNTSRAAASMRPPPPGLPWGTRRTLGTRCSIDSAGRKRSGGACCRRASSSTATPGAANEPPASTTGSGIGSCSRSATRAGACWPSAAG